jgi:hypothetical protein
LDGGFFVGAEREQFLEHRLIINVPVTAETLDIDFPVDKKIDFPMLSRRRDLYADRIFQPFA